MRSRVPALGALVLAASLPLAAVTPAEAGSFGLEDEIKSYQWSPRTGSVSVRVVAECPKRMWRAEVGIELTQKRVTASDRARVTCDGEQRTIVLRLDPKQGRFHPGAVDAWYETGECVSDFCGYGSVQLQDVRIPPPGRAAR